MEKGNNQEYTYIFKLIVVMNFYIEGSLRAVERRFFRIHTLKSAEELEKAHSIDENILRDYRTLHSLYEVGEFLTEGYAGSEPNYVALAYTQIPDKTFNDYGIASNLTNCIYLGSKLSADGIGTRELSRSLLLNPTVKTGPVQYASIERCGSIKNAQVEMAYIRPKVVYLSGFVYKPGSLIHVVKDLKVSGAAAAVLDHEYIHLQGKTALSDPSRMINILRKKHLRKPTIYDRKDLSLEEIVGIYLEKGYNRWLIYEQNQFQVIKPVNPLLHPLSHHTFDKIPLDSYH